MAKLPNSKIDIISNVRKPYVHRTLYKNDYQPLVGEYVWLERH